MKHLKELRLADCKLIGEDMASIAESLGDMPGPRQNCDREDFFRK